MLAGWNQVWLSTCRLRRLWRGIFDVVSHFPSDKNADTSKAGIQMYSAIKRKAIVLREDTGHVG